MNDYFIFDVDGTLTPPREGIEEEFATKFLKFCRKYPTFLCSGSDFKKIREQLGDEVLKASKGIFSCSGNAFWNNSLKEITSLRNSFDPPDSLLRNLNHLVDNSLYPNKFGDHINFRTGMINFSTVGRLCTKRERALYHSWDSITMERKSIVSALSSRYDEIDFSIGGEISIDIYPKGNDKSRSIKLVKKWSDKKDPSICFVGDKIFPGGNDFPAIKLLTGLDSYVQVDSFKDTELFITNFEI